MVKKIKKLIPERLVLEYHHLVALFAAFRYGMPSRKMIVIGVTGTKGKTSTINFIWSTLMAGGFKTGIISTANIRIGAKEVLNKYHMTMPGRFVIQKLLSDMAKEGCKFAIVETTSEGIKQYRHAGINYDIAVFTNLSPEHLQSHGGSFEKYKGEKLKLFSGLSKHRKIIGGKPVEKVMIGNAESEYTKEFLAFPSDRKITFAMNHLADYRAENPREEANGLSFKVAGNDYHLAIHGAFNALNALPAIIIAQLYGISDAQIANGLSRLEKIPGRMEIINEGQNFTVIVDYAHEKESMTGLMETARTMRKPDTKIIVLLGAEGGGRDKSKRPLMGDIVGRLADSVVVSNVDPYDDDPKVILEDIASASEKAGKIRGTNLFVIEDRKEGIHKALSLAKEGDIVLITGKGAEQSMIIAGKKILWDDREVVREELKHLIS